VKAVIYVLPLKYVRTKRYVRYFISGTVRQSAIRNNGDIKMYAVRIGVPNHGPDWRSLQDGMLFVRLKSMEKRIHLLMKLLSRTDFQLAQRAAHRQCG